MAAPYCTLTGTIPGGEKGRATVRIVPDVNGAMATVDGAVVAMRAHVIRTDQSGAVNVDVLAPGTGVTPSGAWTHTIIIDSPECDVIKHVALTQGGTVDIMAATPEDEIAPLPFGGGGGGGGITELPAYLSKTSLDSKYLSQSAASQKYYTKQETNIGLSGKVSTDTFLDYRKAVVKNLTPFKNGSRYNPPTEPPS